MSKPLTCPNGHAMDEGLFECPACGAYRPSINDPHAIVRNGRVVGVKPDRNERTRRELERGLMDDLDRAMTERARDDRLEESTSCPRCGDIIRPDQLRITVPALNSLLGRVEHVACPSERQIRHARRMGRR